MENFAKVIVNAACYEDLKVFCAACCEALDTGKAFLLRTAASWVKVFGGIPGKALLRRGITAVIYTTRERVTPPGVSGEEQLRLSRAISRALTSVVERLAVRPRFLVAKGGITSGDVGVKALGVKRALVLGQIAPGVPVWLTGPESKFPELPYVILPGNVGEEGTLTLVVRTLMGTEGGSRCREGD